MPALFLFGIEKRYEHMPTPTLSNAILSPFQKDILNCIDKDK